jgi:hypothetical protein
LPAALGTSVGRKREGLLAGRLVEQQSPIVHRLGRDRAGTVAFGRFLANRSVMPEEIFAAAGSALGARAAGRHVLAIQDTTHLSFPSHADSGLGPGGNGKVPGLFLFSTVNLIEYQSVFLTRTWVDPSPQDFRVPTEYRPKRAIKSTVYQKGLSEIQTGTIRQRHQGGFDRLRHHLANRPDLVRPATIVVGRFYFSTWRQTDSKSGRKISVRPTADAGLISLDLPVGSTQLHLDIKRSGPQLYGAILSAIATLLAALLLVIGVR